MTVAELLDRISSEELTEWIAEFNIRKKLTEQQQQRMKQRANLKK